jgi:hypothetical protein
MHEPLRAGATDHNLTTWSEERVLSDVISDTRTHVSVWAPVEPLSGCRQVPLEDARVSGDNPQQGKGRTFRATSALLPVPQSVDTDAERVRERLLSHPQEASQGDNIIASVKLATHDALAQLVRNCALEIFLCQLSDI